MTFYFKLPNDSTFFEFIESSMGAERLLLQPFEGTAIYSRKGDAKEIKEEKIKSLQLPTLSTTNTTQQNKESYLKTAEEIIQQIRQEGLSKVVFSRIKTIETNQVHFGKTFLRLAKDFTNAFVYLWHNTQENCIWMGATPEILGIYEPKSKQFQTMSLAGTIPKEQDWSEKEILEQKPVTQYIVDVLKQKASKLFVSQTYSHISGNIKHLRNDIQCSTEKENLGEIIKQLHPTPAVCGFPTKRSKEILHEKETHNRELYAGYIGLELKEKSYYFVNLRCGKFHEKFTHLFLGGGLTALSSAEKEWQETQWKSQALENRIEKK